MPGQEGGLACHSWIQLVEGPRHDTRRYKVVEVFNRGYESVRHLDFTYISKLDADLVFPPNYFERLFLVMDADPRIGAGAGVMEEIVRGNRRIRRRQPANHVAGPLKTIWAVSFRLLAGTSLIS